jgi:hypothetical protein
MKSVVCSHAKQIANPATANKKPLSELPMNFILWTIAIGIIVTVATHISNALSISRLRRSGVYPQPGQTTMADVVRLKKTGIAVLAIRCFREIHDCSLREAKKAVNNLASNP